MIWLSENEHYDDHAWRNQNPLLRAVIEQNPVGKRPLERCHKNVVEFVEAVPIGQIFRWTEKDGSYSL